MPERTTAIPGPPGAEGGVQDLGVALLVSAARFTRWAGRAADAPMPQALWRALSQLEELGPLRVSALAALDRTSQPTATALVARLVEHGWAVRAPDPEDGRAVLVDVSDAGRRQLHEQRAAAARALAPSLGSLAADERADLARGVAVLDRLVAREAPAG
ncbi:MarR family transcriptional regulator [Pseudokineococcus basanitobsidens]|uniref:MarR family transcriptional regulator n=1 Tax=Pseudokineococcus basanitobsidens TaxID=1926649 RepID=A0ABU8RLE4_9ACTN